MMSQDTDYIEPRKVYLDDVEIFDPELGLVPAWKALIYHGVKAKNRLLARADSAADIAAAERPSNIERVPPLVADEAEVREAEQTKLARISDSLDKLESKMDRFAQRVEAVRAVRRAEAVLAETEANPKLMMAACDDFKAPFADLEDVDPVPVPPPPWKKLN